ncbi:GATA transcription factor 19 [Malania oleifera]|uniref:GATA transcription factor 19 n=1 Tax=Malania oleifera TaxID=397392 RepID=UPI0025AE0A3F|nr:GATA transcription factor 19 [Malania oleifera]
MMQRCNSGSGGNMVGPCTCGVFHSQSSSCCSNSFSMLFSVPNNQTYPFDINHEADHMYPFSYSPSSSSHVDCTLSLGTPSTRLTTTTDHENINAAAADRRGHERRLPGRTSSYIPNFCWDILQSKHSSPSSPAAGAHSQKSSSRGGSHTANSSANDPLLARRCANCDTTSTPLWRNGPRGPKSLCNACGIRFKKEERRAAATSSNGSGSAGAGGVASGMMEAQYHPNNGNSSSWAQYYNSQQAHEKSVPNMGHEFRFINNDDDDDRDSPYLSWRLNVADRTALVHDFTR